MIAALILLGIGLFLIFLEFFLPGGVIGIAGGIFVFLSIIVFAVKAGSIWSLILYLVISGVLILCVMKYALWRIRHNKAGKGFYLDRDQAGYIAAQFDPKLIGKKGIAVSDLKQSGFIVVDGKRYQALSKTGYIAQGTEVIVVGGSGAYLHVKPVN